MQPAAGASRGGGFAGPRGYRRARRGLAIENRLMNTLRSLGVALAGRPGSIRRPLAFLIIISAVAELLAPSFLTPNNLQALLTNSSFLIVAAVGEALVILVGMIDLAHGLS
jgi:predicted ABC-type sugar transport system permease subunit